MQPELLVEFASEPPLSVVFPNFPIPVGNPLVNVPGHIADVYPGAGAGVGANRPGHRVAVRTFLAARAPPIWFGDAARESLSPLWNDLGRSLPFRLGR